MKDVKKYTVSILGENYSLLSDEASDTVLRAAHVVDSCMQEILAKSPSLDKAKVAVLTALRLALENEKHADSLDTYKHSAKHLYQLVETILLESC